MISRKSTSLLADLYYAAFTVRSRRGALQKDKELYQLFFDDDYPPELLKGLELYCDHYHPDSIRTFILGLHTGESIESFADKYGMEEAQYEVAGQTILALLAGSLIKKFETSPFHSNSAQTILGSN